MTKTFNCEYSCRGYTKRDSNEKLILCLRKKSIYRKLNFTKGYSCDGSKLACKKIVISKSYFQSLEYRTTSGLNLTFNTNPLRKCKSHFETKVGKQCFRANQIIRKPILMSTSNIRSTASSNQIVNREF